MLNSTMNEPMLANDAPETEVESVDASSEAPGVDMDALLETIEYVRPALQADGGDLVLLGVDGGTVNLQMVGACGGCPMSMMTLKAGIERIMFDRVAGVTEVTAI
jgi:Fe-S cluster biogenesis protein NfuA